jgi:hypothetical protein
MFTKVLTGSLLTGLIAVVGFLVAKENLAPQDCCARKLACCKEGAACCVAEKRLGCCEKGMACCNEVKGCCTGPQACCTTGEKCCEQAKACCGIAPKAKAEKQPKEKEETVDGLTKREKPCCCVQGKTNRDE